MKKKIFAIVLAIVLVLSLSACVAKGGTTFMKGGFEPIPGSNCLMYDPNTRVVYFIYSEKSGYKGYGFMSAYYAPNGLPYLYDVDTGTLVEIQPD